MASGSITITEPDYSEIARRPLDAKNCALVVIDIQDKLFPPIYEKERMLRNSRLLIRLAQSLNIPLLVTTQNAKGLGDTIPEIASLLPDNTDIINKVEFGCFGADRFCSAVKSLPSRRNTLLLCGMETHICVTQTALGALNKGYLVHIPADAVSSRSRFNWRIGLKRMENAGAVISSAEMMMYELLHTADRPEFKQMLAFLKE